MKSKKLLLFLSLTAICLCFSSCSKQIQTVNDAVLMDNESIFAINDDDRADGLYKKTQYALDENEEKSGLADYKNVGVAKTAFENQRYYGSESIKKIDRTIYARDFGADGTDKMSDSVAMKNIVKDCLNHQNEMTKVVFDKGEYDFVEFGDYEHPNYGVYLGGLKNVIFSGNQSTFYFDGEIYGIYAENSSNIYFEDVYIDYGKTPYAVGKLVETSDGETFKAVINNGFNAFDENPNTNIAAWLEYTRYGVLLPYGNDIYGHVKYQSYDPITRILTVKFDQKYNPSPKNTYVVIRYYTYEYDAFHFENCEDMHLESVTLYSCPGFGLGCFSSKNLYINRFNTVLKPDCGRLMSCTADAIHTIDTYGEVLVSNCLFENCGDDALNVHGAYWRIYEITGESTFIARNDKGYDYKAYPGDKIEIIGNDALPIQTLTVKSCSDYNYSEGGFTVETIEKLDDTIFASNCVGNVTRSPKLVFQNNVVRNKRCRGLLVKTRDVVISNCTFSYCASGIILGTDTDNWGESINPKNVEICNNKFMNLNFGNTSCNGDILFSTQGKSNVEAGIGAIQDVNVENNYFYNGGTSGVAISSSKGIKVSHNLFNNNGTYAEELKRVMTNSAIILSNSEDISLSYNSVYGNSSASFKPVFVGNNIKTANISVVGNNGFTAADLVDKVAREEFAIPKVSPLGMDNASLSDWKNVIDSKYQTKICASADEYLHEVEIDESSFKLNDAFIAVSNDGLYVGYDVFDDELSFYSSDTYWSGDGCELFVCSDTENTDALETVKIDSDIDCLEVFTSGERNWGKQVVTYRTSKAIQEKVDQITILTKIHDDLMGYCAKIYIPFSVIPNIQNKLMTQKEKISICLNFSDRDTSGRIQHASCFNIVEYNKYVPGKMNMVYVEGLAND